MSTGIDPQEATHAHPKVEKAMHWLDFAFWSVAGSLAVGAATVVLVFGVQFLRVLSPSMVPALPVGDVVVVRHMPADQVSIGDVVVLRTPREGAPYIHRITRIERDDRGLTVYTKGDANPVEDPWAVRLFEPQVHVLVMVLPLNGLTHLMDHAQPLVLPLFLIGVGATGVFAWYAIVRREDE